MFNEAKMKNSHNLEKRYEGITLKMRPNQTYLVQIRWSVLKENSSCKKVNFRQNAECNVCICRFSIETKPINIATAATAVGEKRKVSWMK